MKLNIKNIVALISLAIIGLIVVQVIWINNAIDVRKSQFDQEVKNSLVVVTQNVPKVIQQNQETKFFQRQKQMNNGVADFNAIIDAMLDNTPFKKFSDKISKEQLDSLIKKEMLKRGINTPYVFSVFDKSGSPLFTQDSLTKSFNDKLLSEGINIPVYAGDFMLTQPFISIIFLAMISSGMASFDISNLNNLPASLVAAFFLGFMSESITLRIRQFFNKLLDSIETNKQPKLALADIEPTPSFKPIANTSLASLETNMLALVNNDMSVTNIRNQVIKKSRLDSKE